MSDTSRSELPISFSVLRLSKPEFVTELPVKLDLEQDIRESEPVTLDEAERSRLVGEEGFSGRIHAQSASALSGLDGYLNLPVHFSQVHLGESLMCYVSACNNSGYSLSQVELVVEVSTHRARSLLYENREEPIHALASEERRDFIVRYDIKDVGEHQLKCMASYTTPKKERIVLPVQAIQFVAMSPLSIRTKVRYIGESCLLEACIECLKQNDPLMLEYIHFEPAKRFRAAPIALQQEDVQEGPLKDYLSYQASKARISAAGLRTRAVCVQLMDGQHRTRNFLFRLDPVTAGIQQGDLEVKTLGRLEIKWRTGFGEVGRLQTQQIMRQQSENGSPGEVMGYIVAFTPQDVVVYQPFQIIVALMNFTDDSIGPITIALNDETEAERGAIRVSGVEKRWIGDISSGARKDVQISLVSFKSGIQTIQDLKIVDETTGGVVGTVESRDIFVAPYEGGRSV